MDFAGDRGKDEVNKLAKTLERVFRKDEDTTPESFSTTVNVSLEKETPKNPLLLIPVIRSVLKFLNVEDIKNCRLVSRDWGLFGKLALASFSKIQLISSDGRRPADFNSCFLDSTTLFSAFEIGEPWSTEELANFFGEQQKYIKELAINFEFSIENLAKNIDITSWISKSPMVQKDVKHMTKLSIKSYLRTLDILPLHLITHIKDLTLSNSRINLEDGIQICPIKLKLKNAKFCVDGFKLDRVSLNDIVDFSRAKEVSVRFKRGRLENLEAPTEYIVDLSGSTILESLVLSKCEILNWKTSQWSMSIQHLATIDIPYALNSQMEIKELALVYAGPIDLFTLPTSIQKLALYLENDTPIITCSQPTVFPNLQYLQIVGAASRNGTDCEFLSHFVDSLQLTHLKFNRCGRTEMKSIWMPKTLKTLTLEYSIIKWLDNCDLNLEKLVYHGRCTTTNELSTAKILKDDFDLVMHHYDVVVDKYLVNVLEYRKTFSFRHRLYIGKLRWDNEILEESILKEYVDVKSSFYVFENGEKGRVLSETHFHDLIEQQHLYVPPY